MHNKQPIHTRIHSRATWVVDRVRFIDSNATSLRSTAGAAVTKSFFRALSTGRRTSSAAKVATRAGSQSVASFESAHRVERGRRSRARAYLVVITRVERFFVVANASHSRSFTPARDAATAALERRALVLQPAHWWWRGRRRRRLPRVEVHARITPARLGSGSGVKPGSSGLAVLRIRERLRESCCARGFRRVLLRLGGRRLLTHGSQALCALCRDLVHAESSTHDERRRDARALWRRAVPFESWLALTAPLTVQPSTADRSRPARERGGRWRASSRQRTRRGIVPALRLQLLYRLPVVGCFAHLLRDTVGRRCFQNTQPCAKESVRRCSVKTKNRCTRHVGFPQKHLSFLRILSGSRRGQ